MKRWSGIESISFRLNKRRNRAWVCCFFSQKPNKTFCLVSVKKTQHGKNGFGFVVYGLLCMGLLCLVSGKNTGVWVCCVWVCCVWFLGKIQGFGFYVYGLPRYVIEKKGRGSISNGEERWLSREGMGNLVNDDLFVGETKGAFSLSDSLSLLCLCMGLLCLVFGKNTRVLVCCG